MHMTLKIHIYNIQDLHCLYSQQLEDSDLHDKDRMILLENMYRGCTW